MLNKFLKEAKTSFIFNDGAKEMVRTCQPFFDRWGFENFYYVRITKKGELVYLTNNVNFAMEYWEEGLPLRTGFDVFPEVVHFSSTWDGIIDDEILKFTETKSCFDGFSFVDRYYDTIQFASFLRSNPMENSKGFYLKNQETLRCWLREFEWKNRGLIRHAEENPIVLPEEYLAPQRGAFYQERTMEISHRGIRSKISFRELDCLHLHGRGFTCPRIALMLGISPRTVETHLDAVKNRFGLFTRDELASLAYTNPLIQTYSPRLKGD